MFQIAGLASAGLGLTLLASIPIFQGNFMPTSQTNTRPPALVLSALALWLASALPASAGLITSTIGEFDGPTLSNPTYPQPSITIGTFTYSPPTSPILAASVSGFFGTTYAPSTALENLFVGGNEVASCASEAADCWNDPSGVQTPWTYTFTPSQFSVLESGSVPYTVVQTGDFQVESGVTTLSITVAPEPTTVWMFGGGFSLLLFVHRKRRA
jgi:hypothetical protein